jgi:hypothetical protein
MRVGIHFSFNRANETVSTGSFNKTHFVDQYYAALKIVPNYFLAKNISRGIYFLNGRGVQQDAIKTTHFVTLNANF